MFVTKQWSIASPRLAFVVLALFWPVDLLSQDVSPRERIGLERLVKVESGELPILITAPHGGTLEIPDVSVRKGEGMEKGGKGYFIGRDSGTEELAGDVVQAIQRELGKRPYSVVASSHRKFLDPNRPPEIAYEDPDAKPTYDRFHNHVASYSRKIQNEFHCGLLLDIHGQGSSAVTVYRGTGNGKTVKLLRERFGDEAHTGPESLFGLLKKGGWTVYPDPFDGKEQAGFTGGYIVQTYGSSGEFGMDAIQLEFGANYRSKASREETANVLAKAVAEYAKLYLKIKPQP